MARIARAVAPGLPHHITQRGNRRMPTFFCDEDYQTYLSLLAEFCRRYHVDIWAYCLMPNHVHLVALPEYADGLRGALGETHRRYTRHINFREDWRGHLWQERFASFVMDYHYTLAAVRYIELNPVRAGLVAQAGDYPWSSAHAHLTGTNDSLVNVVPMCSEISDWAAFLCEDEEEEILEKLHSCERTGRPCGDNMFISKVESICGRILRRQKPGPKRKKDGR